MHFIFQGSCLIQNCRYYSATILTIAGFTDPSEAIWLAAAVSFCNLFGSCVGLYLVEKSGRRPLTLFSLGFVVASLLGLSITFYAALHQSEQTDVDASYGTGSACNSYKYCFDCVQDKDCGFCTDLYGGEGGSGGTGQYACISKDSDDDGALFSSLCSGDDFYGLSCPASETIGWVIFMGMCLYLLVFSPGMGPMPWCINSEIYSTEARGLGNSISTTVNWTSNLVMSMTFLTLISELSAQGAFMLYALISALFFLFFFMFLPETKGIASLYFFIYSKFDFMFMCAGVPLENTMLLFQKDNWGRAHWNESDLNKFLELSADDSSGALLGGARKIDVHGDISGLTGVHIRETTVSEDVNSGRTLSAIHNNEPPENDFMYHSVTSSAVAKKLLGTDTSSSTLSDVNNLNLRLSVTSL